MNQFFALITLSILPFTASATSYTEASNGLSDSKCLYGTKVEKDGAESCLRTEDLTVYDYSKYVYVYPIKTAYTYEYPVQTVKTRKGEVVKVKTSGKF